MNDHIIKAARSIWGESAILPMAEIERFYALAYRAGLEDAAKIVQTNAQYCEPDEYGHMLLASNAAAIRARGQGGAA
jgi:hypothetical protein